MKRTLYQAYLTLAALEGVIVLWFTLGVPAIEGSTGLLDLPTSRLAISAVTLIGVILFACLALVSTLNRRWVERVMRWLADRLIPGDRLLHLTLILLGGLLVSIALCMPWQLPVLREYRWYSAIFKFSMPRYEVLLVAYERIYPLLVWVALLISQTLAALLIDFWDEYRREGFWKWQVISKATLVMGMIGLSAIQWAVLAMRISMQKLIPGWYWDVNLRPFSARHLFFALFLAVSLGLVTFILRHPRRVLLGLLILIGLGYLLQVGFGLIEGSGYEYVRMKYADSKHRSYALVATGESPQPLDVIRQYEEKYGYKMFPGTKPPGVVVLYVSL